MQILQGEGGGGGDDFISIIELLSYMGAFKTYVLVIGAQNNPHTECVSGKVTFAAVFLRLG